MGFADKGTARVKVEVITVLGVDDLRSTDSGKYRHIQLGAFRSRSSADLLVQRLQTLTDSPVVIRPVQVGKAILYRVRVGPLSSREVFAEKTLLESKGFVSLQLLP